MDIPELAIRAGLLLLLFSALVGLGLLVMPEAMARLGSVQSGWAPLSRLLVSLDRIYRIERFFYRHHRVFGAFLLAGSAYTLAQTLLNPGVLTGARAWGALGETAIWSVLGGNLLGLLLGLVVLVRPSLLKEPERLSNRWISIAPVSPLWGAGPDAILPRQPRLAGAFILGGSVYALMILLQYF